VNGHQLSEIDLSKIDVHMKECKSLSYCFYHMSRSCDLVAGVSTFGTSVSSLDPMLWQGQEPNFVYTRPAASHNLVEGSGLVGNRILPPFSFDSPISKIQIFSNDSPICC